MHIQGFDQVLVKGTDFQKNGGTLAREVASTLSPFKTTMQNFNTAFKSWDVHNGQPLTQMVFLEMNNQVEMASTKVGDWWDLAEKATNLGKQQTLVNAKCRPGSKVTLNGIQFGAVSGLTQALLKQYTSETATDSDSYLTVGTLHFRKGIHGPMIKLNYVDTTPQILLSGLTIPSIKVFYTSTNYTHEDGLLLKQEGAKCVAKFTLQDSHIQKVDCAGCKQYLFSFHEMIQSGIYLFKNLKIQDYGRDDTQRAANSVIKIKAYKTEFNKPISTFNFDNFTCLRAYSYSCACVRIIILNYDRTFKLPPQNLNFNNCTFQENMSQEGAIFWYEGIHAFHSLFTDCRFVNNKETKAWWAADFAIDDGYNKNATYTFDRCTFLNPWTPYGGWCASLAFQSEVNHVFKVSNSLWDCQRQPFDQDPRKAALYYLNAPKNKYYSSIMYLRNAQLDFHNVTVQNCHGMQKGALWTDRNTNILPSSSNITFRNNSGLLGSIINTKAVWGGTTFVIDNWVVENNLAYNGGFVFFKGSDMTIKNSIITNNYAMTGGVIFSDGSTGSLLLLNTTIENNTAFGSGAVLFQSSGRKLHKFDHCKVVGNFAEQRALFVVDSGGQLAIDSTILQNNYVKVGVFGVEVSASRVNATNTTFTIQANYDFANSKASGAFITVQANSVVFVDQCKFINAKARSGGAINGEGEFNVTVTNSKFLRNQADRFGGAMYFTSKKFITLKNVEMVDCATDAPLQGGSAIYANQQVDLNFDNVSITYTQPINPLQVIYLKNVYFVANNLTISVTKWGQLKQRTQIPLGGGILGLNLFKFELTNSKITNINHVLKGGGIGLQKTQKSLKLDNPILLKSVEISRNFAQQKGGGIYINQIEYIHINSSKIINNRANNTDSQGGGICYISDESTSTPRVYISNDTEIMNNYCGGSGGGVYWNQYSFTNIPSITSNSAGLYGDNMASYPSSIILVKQTRRALNGAPTPASTALAGQQSGGTLPVIQAALIDQRGFIVKSDSSSKGVLGIKTTQTTKSKYGLVLKGTTSVGSVNGVFTFKDIVLIADPGVKFSFFISSQGIDLNKPDNKDINGQQVSNTLDITIQMRNCTKGEAFKDNGECKKCLEGEEYLLGTYSTPTNCKECVSTSMRCFGGYIIGPKPGYWRSSNTTSNIMPCLNPISCLGTDKSNYNPVGHCQERFSGFLCSDCVDGYSRVGNFDCAKCPKLWLNLLQIIGLYIAGIVVICIMVRSTIKGSSKKKSPESIYQKILMNHVIMMSLVGTFEFNWSTEVRRLFDMFDFGSEASTQMLSVECLYLDLLPKGLSSLKYYFFNLLVYVLLPVILALIARLFWNVVYLRYRSEQWNQLKKGRIMSTTIILLFLIHPNIVKVLMDSFNCMDVDNTSRMVSVLDKQCWKSTHLFLSIFLSIPGIVIWGLGIPLFSFLVLWFDRKNLKDEFVMNKYGFLFKGYKLKYYYWESIIMIRKILINFIAVILKQSGNVVQSLVVFLMLIFFVFLNKEKQPFQIKAMNQLEELSIIVSMITVYCGFYYLSDHPEIYESDNENLKVADNKIRLTDHYKNLLFAIILVSNLIFLIYWLKTMSSALLDTIKTKLPTLYRLITFQKIDKDNQIVEIVKKDAHEMLREEYEIMLHHISDIYEQKRIILTPNMIERLHKYLHPTQIYKSIGYTKPETHRYNEEIYTKLRTTKTKSQDITASGDDGSSNNKVSIIDIDKTMVELLKEQSSSDQLDLESMSPHKQTSKHTKLKPKRSQTHLNTLNVSPLKDEEPDTLSISDMHDAISQVNNKPKKRTKKKKKKRKADIKQTLTMANSNNLTKKSTTSDHRSTVIKIEPLDRTKMVLHEEVKQPGNMLEVVAAASPKGFKSKSMRPERDQLPVIKESYKNLDCIDEVRSMKIQETQGQEPGNSPEESVDELGDPIGADLIKISNLDSPKNKHQGRDTSTPQPQGNGLNLAPTKTPILPMEAEGEADGPLDFYGMNSKSEHISTVQDDEDPDDTMEVPVIPSSKELQDSMDQVVIQSKHMDEGIQAVNGRSRVSQDHAIEGRGLSGDIETMDIDQLKSRMKQMEDHLSKLYEEEKKQ